MNLTTYSSVILALLSINNASAGDNEIKFKLTDDPAHWFDTGTAIAGSRSLAIASPGVRVKFTGDSRTVHTRTSVIFPTGAANMPFNTKPTKGGDVM